MGVDAHFVPLCVVFLHERMLRIWYSLEFMCLLHISASRKHSLSFEAKAWIGHKDTTSLEGDNQRSDKQRGPRIRLKTAHHPALVSAIL